LPDGVSQALREYLENSLDEYAWKEAEHGNGHHANEKQPTPAVDETRPPNFKIGDLCPDCGQAAVVNEEGCRKCYACGYSEC